MKKLLLLLMLMPILTNAQNEDAVSIREAEAVTARWIAQRHVNYPLNINDTYVYTDSANNPIFYEVKTDSVTLLLTGNKACIPVIGVIFGSDKNILRGYETRALPEGLLSLIDEYKTQVGYCYLRQNQRVIHNSRWQELLDPCNSERLVRTVQVGPLTKSQWTQERSNSGSDYNAYNCAIPPDSNNTCEHCKVGCVAVAMGQLMYYHQYPLISKSLTKQFDWCNMTNTLDCSVFNSNYDKNKKAIAYLLRECGRFVNMQYGCSSSRARTRDCRDALVNGFGYSTEAVYLERAYFSNTDWIELLKNNLDNKMPVIYRGTGARNHAFICDGYRDDLFCFNWGDFYLNNYNIDFYSLEQIAPMYQNFSYNQAAVFNIHPTSWTDICDNELILDNFYTGNPFVVFPFFYNPYDITPTTSTKLISASIETIPSWRTIPANVTASYQAHEEIVLRDGFTAVRGCNFTAKIEPCVRCDNRGNDDNADDEIFMLTQDNSEDFFAYAVDCPSASDGLYPNPTDGKVTATTDGKADAIVIYTMDGRPIGGWNILSLDDNQVTLDVSTLPSGTYLLTIRTPKGITTKKLVVSR